MIRSLPIRLLGLDEKPVTNGNVVVDEHGEPALVMFNGDPFLAADANADGSITYRQVRPYRFAGKGLLS